MHIHLAQKQRTPSIREKKIGFFFQTAGDVKLIATNMYSKCQRGQIEKIITYHFAVYLAIPPLHTKIAIIRDFIATARDHPMKIRTSHRWIYSISYNKPTRTMFFRIATMFRPTESSVIRSFFLVTFSPTGPIN